MEDKFKRIQKSFVVFGPDAAELKRRYEETLRAISHDIVLDIFGNNEDVVSTEITETPDNDFEKKFSVDFYCISEREYNLLIREYMEMEEKLYHCSCELHKKKF